MSFKGLSKTLSYLFFKKFVFNSKKSLIFNLKYIIIINIDKRFGEKR